ncbi:hypothetical protein [Dichelobacter nodosus]|uniref:hypothetical protein n=1 Tax=Dichelobacter nodosus TaxID=870 RepID=UPI000681F6F3|nr:hypothetical protein [Dichelobacter nodosus]KNZ39955.1 hypothetical protein AKG33_00995 [Dichelobacter nodosus]
MIDEKTKNYDFPLPDAENLLSEDVKRIKTTFNRIDEALSLQKKSSEEVNKNLAEKLAKIRILALAAL